MAFEFDYKNYFNTTSLINVTSATVSNILNREKSLQYVTTGFNDDTTTLTLTITFTQTQSVSRIALLNHNLKDFKIYYNGATANTFSLSGANTTTLDFATNSDVSQFFRVPTTAVSSISMDMRKTIVANNDKAVGYWYVGADIMGFDRDPAANNYQPIIDPEQIAHKLSDGGTRLHNLAEKYASKISFKYISESFRNEFKSIYDMKDQFWFCPFGTSGSWDGIFFECVWEGNFDFYRYSDNAQNAGFSGSIMLKETPN